MPPPSLPRRPIFSPAPAHTGVETLRGAAQLAADATLGVADIAEGVHETVWRTLGVPGKRGRTRGLTGRVYAAVRGLTRLIGTSLDVGLASVPGLRRARAVTAPPKREAAQAVLNGVVGDHLAATGNPLATPMALRVGTRTLVEEGTSDETAPLSLASATQRVALLVHGLCMDDHAWTLREGTATTHAEALAARGYTPVALRYNTGRSVAENGRLLAALLDRLVARWPVPVEEVVMIGHSMGGLVIRSALHQAEATDCAWRGRVTHAVFLGTPHLGAPLEQAGSWVDTGLTLTPYSAPFAAIGAMRSAGITDLRHGHVIDGEAAPPLPTDVACYALAATLATATAHRRPVATLVGDGLVPVASALGRHRDPRRALPFAAGHRRIVYETGHLALLRAPAVTQMIDSWL